MISRKKSLHSLGKSLCVVILFSAALPKGLAQQILNEQGLPIPQNPNVEYVPNEIIVNFIAGTITLPPGQIEANLAAITIHPQVEPLFRTTGVSKVSKIFRFFTAADTTRILETGQRVQVQDLSQVFLLSFPAAVNVAAMLGIFKGSSHVIHAQPNYIYYTEGTPNDPAFSNQWALEQTTDEDIDATAAWDIQTGSYSIKIGIFDSGIDYGHADLGNAFGLGWKVVGGWDWVNNDSDPRDDNYHGTLLAGIAGALTNNTNNGQYVGIAGVAGGWGYERSTNTGNKGAQLFAMKIANANGQSTSARAADAIIEGADPDGDGWGYGIHVLNNSYGSYTYDENLRSAINYAARMNRVFAASKGNDGSSALHYPSDYDGSWVISVGATDQTGAKAGFSNTGNGIDVAAPGVSIYSTTPTYQTTAMINNGVATNYDFRSGTSLAVPQVAGLAALIFSQNSTLHPEEVQGIMRASADDKPPTGYDNDFGAGRINAGRALQYMQSPWTLNRWTASGGTSVGNTGTYQATFYNTGGGLATGVYIVKRYDVRKTVSFPVQFSGTPYVWGRGVNATTGWSAANPNYQTGYCKVASSTATSAQLQTFVYEVWSIGGARLGWYPTSPSNVTFAYTVLGMPQPLSVSMDGPTDVYHPEKNEPANTYRWDAIVSGGVSPFTITWFKTINGYTSQVGAGSYYLETFYYDGAGGGVTQFTLRVDVSDASSQFATASKVVNEHHSGVIPAKATDTAGSENTPLPREFALSQNFPNPFNPETEIRLGLPKDEHVQLLIIDLMGREVRRLTDNVLKVGFHSVLWDGKDNEGREVPSGVYFYQIIAGDFRAQKKLALVR